MTTAIASQSDRLLTRQQAAEFLGLQVQTLAAWAMTGKHLPFIKVGRSVRYRQSHLDAYIEKQTIGATD